MHEMNNMAEFHIFVCQRTILISAYVFGGYESGLIRCESIQGKTPGRMEMNCLTAVADN